MAEKMSMIALTLLACMPGIGYSIYLWKQKKRGAAIGNMIPGLGALALAIIVLIIL